MVVLRRLLVVMLVALFAVVGQGNAYAADDPGTEVLRSVVTAKSPAEAWQRLTPQERRLAHAAVAKNLKVTRDNVKSGGSPSLSPMVVSGCWYDYEYSNITLFGISIGSIWMQLNWCGRNGSITSYSVDPYGCSGKNGFSCSASSPSIRNVGWEVRAAVSYAFTTFQGLSSSVCGQIRGGATGLYSTRMSCDLR